MLTWQRALRSPSVAMARWRALLLCAALVAAARTHTAAAEEAAAAAAAADAGPPPEFAKLRVKELQARPATSPAQAMRERVASAAR